MDPLFSSGQFDSKLPHMRWFIPKDKAHIGQSLVLAGKPVGLWTHRVGRRTWPCLKNWPSLDKECPHCERSRRWTTWCPCLPLADPARQLILMGGETTWKSLNGVKRGEIIICKVAMMLKPTIMFVKHALQVGTSTARLGAVMQEIGNGDITRWLLHYWQWTDLARWYGETIRESIKSRTARERAEADGTATGLPLSFSASA
jgi:hypothetical protein